MLTRALARTHILDSRRADNPVKLVFSMCVDALGGRAGAGLTCSLAFHSKEDGGGRVSLTFIFLIAPTQPLVCVCVRVHITDFCHVSIMDQSTTPHTDYVGFIFCTLILFLFSPCCVCICVNVLFFIAVTMMILIIGPRLSAISIRRRR